MATYLLKTIVSLIFAIWIGVIAAQFIKDRDDDDNWPQDGVAA